MTFKDQPSDETLKHAVNVYMRLGGNKSATARELDVPRKTLSRWIEFAESRFDLDLSSIADGRIGEIEREVAELPEPGQVKRYILTSVQNNTFLHPGWVNLKAYAEWLDALPNGSCEFMVGTFSYAIDAYGAKAVKRGKWKPDVGSLWYAPEIEEHIRDERIELAPGLVWCGEMNILPTAKHPLTGLETYNGRKSNIVPHTKITMESVPSMRREGTKLNFSTGTITMRNYIQKRAGIIAEAHHSYGGLLVEVADNGDWFVRQLHIDHNGQVYDLGPDDGKPGAVLIADKKVTRGAPVDSIVWGDIHTAEMEPWVRETGWGASDRKGMLDVLRPARQIMHDIFSMRSRGHHEMKDFHALYEKRAAGMDSVEAEVAECAEFLRSSSRKWCETVIVLSNHDRHLNRWLRDEDPRKDLLNAKYHAHLQETLLDAIDRREVSFNVLAFALGEKGLPESVRFLGEDESFVICRDVDGGIECGLHGDLGSGGARGSTRNLTKLGRPLIKGHDHTAAIRENVYSVGACSLEFPYMKGPSAHSVSHVVTFPNAKRQIVTMWRGRWRAS